MHTRTLIKLSGVAAFAAGALRIVATLVSIRSGDARELLYLSVDLCLVFAIPGIYLSRHAQLGLTGFVGFVLALAGAASLVGPDGTLFGIDMYRLGGLVLMLGLGLLAYAQLSANVQRAGSSIGCVITLLATMGAVTSTASWFPLAVGICFGSTFIAFGLELFREARTHSSLVLDLSSP
jgi:hypothetical protein